MTTQSPKAAPSRCLLEPALLYCILQELSQKDLLLAQRVCRTWRAVITSNKILLKQLYLHPGAPDTQASAQPSTANPLLASNFPGFFHSEVNDNRFSAGRDNLGPFIHSSMLPVAPEGRERRVHMSKAWLRPEASWRRMLPCLPPPKGLQIAIGSMSHGTLRCLSFSNDDDNSGAIETNDSHPMSDSKAHGHWLTFGLLYDLIEESWFQNAPHQTSWVKIDIPCPRQQLLHPGSPWAFMLLEKLAWAPKLHREGSVYVQFQLEQRSKRELEKSRKIDRKYITGQRPLIKWCGTKPFRGRFDQVVFTEELHVAGGVGLKDVEWDEIREYGSVPSGDKVKHVKRLSLFRR